MTFTGFDYVNNRLAGFTGFKENLYTLPKCGEDRGTPWPFSFPQPSPDAEELEQRREMRKQAIVGECDALLAACDRNFKRALIMSLDHQEKEGIVYSLDEKTALDSAYFELRKQIENARDSILRALERCFEQAIESPTAFVRFRTPLDNL